MGLFSDPKTYKKEGGGKAMALFLSKNFAKMTQAEIDNTSSHYGKPEVTSRSFIELIGREREELREDKILEEILDQIDRGEIKLAPQLPELLRVEFGHEIRFIKDLPADILRYLRNTPHDIVWTEYIKAIQMVRALFENRINSEKAEHEEENK